MGAFLGRDCSIEVLLEKDTRAKGSDGKIPKPVSPTYLLLGGTRGLTDGAEWATTDVTNRSSFGNVRESLVTFLSVSGSTDGIYLPETAENIAAARDYVMSPTSGQPYAWIRVTYPGATAGATITEELYCLLSSFNRASPYDDATTFDMAWEGQQAPIVTTVPAP
jgi:predicted secreted protein